MTGNVHIVGGGLSGLACAVRLVRAGIKVHLYEAAGHCGGRCRSFHDNRLQRRIDNGNHLMLSGNRSLMEYLNETGAADSMASIDNVGFPFFDLESGDRWNLRPNRGRLPWWMFVPSRRVPSTSALDYLSGCRRLASAAPGATVADCLDTGSILYRRFWYPFTIAVLNTGPEQGVASLLWAVLDETIMKGGAACVPIVARRGLSESLVNPAIDYLNRGGCEISFRRRLKSLSFTGGRVAEMNFGDQCINLGAKESVVLAVPPDAAANLIDGLVVPDQFRSIVNAHFLLPASRDEISILGMIGGLGQWLCVRGDIASVTVSDANAVARESASAIAERLWPEVASALELKQTSPGPCRVVKERRATFAQTSEQIKRRPSTGSAWNNLFFAGDWTDTALPATIEGAIRSAHAAALAIAKI